MTTDIEKLLKPRLPEADVDIPGIGIVRVRGLSRSEVMIVRKATDNENLDGPRALHLERKLLATAMVDPQMTESQVGTWQEVSAAGELEPVVNKVQELSGMLPDSAKQQFNEFEKNPDAEFPVLPSPEAGNDSR